MDEITGTLENWSFVSGFYFGDVYGDTKGRFADGTPIRTSHIKSAPGKQGDIVTTRNSRYKLGAPATTTR